MPATATARPGSYLLARPISDLLPADTLPPPIHALRRCHRCDCILSIYADADAVMRWNVPGARSDTPAITPPTATGSDKMGRAAQGPQAAGTLGSAGGADFEDRHEAGLPSRSSARPLPRRGRFTRSLLNSA
jgi:hypothetical protein